MSRSRIVETCPGQAVRVRVLPDATGAPVIEITQLHRTRGGYESEKARAFVPLDRLHEFLTTLGEVEADELDERVRAANRPRLRAIDKGAPRAPMTYKQWRGGEF